MDSLLDLPMQTNDAEANTIRDYLKALLRTLFEEDEGFSGKRPFGNSGWVFDVYQPLVRAGIVRGTLDENGCIEEVDAEAAAKKIQEAIASL